MNNSNFGYDSRSNIDSGTFAPISNELDEILYLKIIPKSFWYVNVQIYFLGTFRAGNRVLLQQLDNKTKNRR